MNTPPLLVLATLLFWGWQTGHPVLGGLAGVALESSRIIQARWSLTQADFNRLMNICIVLFIGVGTFLLINEGTVSFNEFFADAGKRPDAIKRAGRSALVWFQWFPMIFLPFVLAQVFNETPRVGLSTFSWWLRKQEALRAHSALPRDTINVSFAYVALCLLSASARTERAALFYIGFTALVAWALLAVRTKRLSLAAWCALFAVVAGAGYGGHMGLSHLQKRLEEMEGRWLAKFAARGFSDKESRTRLGSIGRLKNSSEILLRIQTDGSAPPEYLREASYGIYRAAPEWTRDVGYGASRAPTWTTTNRHLGAVISENDLTTWKLLPRKRTGHTISIGQYLRGGTGLLPLPSGSAVLGNLPVPTVETNAFGVVKAADGPGMILFHVSYDRGATMDSAPSEEDTRTYDDLEPAVRRIARELDLQPGLGPDEARRRVAKFFAERFQYASYLTSAHAPTTNESALARFLLHTRSGHCEYFATATTLLLRQAGVPTRYAVGYSVQEGRGKKYLVRERHAHAWTLMWDGKSWIDFDTTPGSWNAAESAHTSWLQPLNDFFSDLWFQFSKFRWGQTEWRKWFMLAPVPLLIVVLVRFFFGKQWKKIRARQQERAQERRRPGIDSDFYRIERHFATRGLERRASENWSQWLRRVEDLESAGLPEATRAALERVLALHQRHRFDPAGLNEAERGELRAQVAAWLRDSEWDRRPRLS